MKDTIKFIIYIINYRKFILISLLITVLLSSIIAFVIPQQFTSSVSLTPPAGSSQSLLSSLTSISKMAGSFFDIGGFSAQTVDLYIDILRSNSVVDSLILKYDLQKRYHLKTLEHTRLKVKRITKFDIGASEMLTISFTDRDPQFAKDVCNDYIYYLKKQINLINIQKQQENLKLYEDLYQKQILIVEELSNRLNEWLKRNRSLGVEFSVQQKTPSMVSLYDELIKEKSEFYKMKYSLPDTSMALKNKMLKIKELEKSVDSISYSIYEKPEEVVKYTELKIDMEVALRIKNELLGQLNLIKSNLEKPTDNVFFVDMATVPTLKSFPPRKEIVIISFLLIFVLEILFLGIKYYLETNLEDKERKEFYKYLKLVFYDPFQKRKDI
ncbi:MAG: hypothetical protein WHT27_03665 [candidate division WOR-3 bacterium]